MNLLSVSDVAQELKLSQPTVRQLLSKGGLPFIRIGRRILLRREDLETFVKSRREAADSITSR